MKKTLCLLALSMPVLCAGTALADMHEMDGPDPATPIEMFACKFHDGKDMDDLEAVIDDWNRWADRQDINDYSAWTLLPYYAGPDQDFDVLWLGGAPTAVALGRAQDRWIATGGKVSAAYDEVIDCHTHANYAVLEFKEPPERDNPDNIVIAFSDCNLSDGTTFGELVPAMMEWAEYRQAHDSTAGMWAMMPAFGGGGEDFDFKWVTAYQNFEDLGADYDQYSESGWQKGNELFESKVGCDSSRIYLATNQRRGEDSDD